MKITHTILALIALSSVATSQPVFRDVSWGMTVDAISAAESRDARAPFADTTFGVAAVAVYRFDLRDRLIGVEFDLSFPHSRANIELAERAIEDYDRVAAALSARYGDSTDLTSYRPDDEGYDDYEGRAWDLLVGRSALRTVCDDLVTLVDHTADCVTARLIHNVTLRPRDTPSAVSQSAPRPSVMSLR